MITPRKRSLDELEAPISPAKLQNCYTTLNLSHQEGASFYFTLKDGKYHLNKGTLEEPSGEWIPSPKSLLNSTGATTYTGLLKNQELNSERSSYVAVNHKKVEEDPLVSFLDWIQGFGRSGGADNDDESDVHDEMLSMASRSRIARLVTKEADLNLSLRSRAIATGPDGLQKPHALKAEPNTNSEIYPSWRRDPTTLVEDNSFNYHALFGGHSGKPVPIGSNHQATIPDLRPIYNPLTPGASPTIYDQVLGRPLKTTAQMSDEELWLGMQVWPPPANSGSLIAECHEINLRDIETTKVDVGKGRPTRCSCEEVGSVECVRLHVEEEDFRLRAMVGKAAYYAWGLHEMGEKYIDAARWSQDEEDNFMSTVHWCPPSRNVSFWNYLKKTLPMRKRRELVSYYFNVFMLRRRAAQNRLYPEASIDSDDDETSLFDEGETSEQEVDDGQGESEEMERNGAKSSDFPEENDKTEGEYSSGEMGDSSFINGKVTNSIEGFSKVLQRPDAVRKVGMSVMVQCGTTGRQEYRSYGRDESIVNEKKAKGGTVSAGLGLEKFQGPLDGTSKPVCPGSGIDENDGSVGYASDVVEFETCQNSELDSWRNSLEYPSGLVKDNLLSTNLVMEELFGNEEEWQNTADMTTTL